MNQLKRNAPTQSLMGFVPFLVLKNFIDHRTQAIVLPFRQKFTSVVMFADISGFTRITENLSKDGPEGAEKIAYVINKYMELIVSAIGKSGGDIFKFTGDTMILIWPPSVENTIIQPENQLQFLCRQAVQSALDIQQLLSDTLILETKLSVKIGLGVGETSIIYVGGVFQRSEYLPVGESVIQAFKSEQCCQNGGQIVVSREVYKMVKESFSFQQLPMSPTNYRCIQEDQNVRKKTLAIPIRQQINAADFQIIKHHILPYIPAALLPYIAIDEEKWSTELRYLTIVFVNLGIDLREANLDLGLQKIQKVIETVQKCVYMHEGSVNKLLMNEKGSTMIVVFGLPPLGHQDDAVRAILMSFLFIEELEKSGVSCSMGVATGTVFTGVIGVTGQRREYSVFGDVVNLASRLMQQASMQENKRILCCQQTAQDASNKLKFQFYKNILLKGKGEDTSIFVPSIRMQETWYDPIPEIKPHLHQQSLQWLKLQQSSSSSQQQLDPQPIIWDILGQEKNLKDIQSKVDRFLRGKDKKGIYIINGTYGSGKSLTLKNILMKVTKKINRGQYSEWKYGEKNAIFICQILPLEKDKVMNGVGSMFQQMFAMIAQRRGQQPTRKYFESLLKPEDYLMKDYRTFQKTLGLRRTDAFKNFPPVPQKQEPEDLAFSQRQFKSMTFALMALYFEKAPLKYQKRSTDDPSQSLISSPSQLEVRTQQAPMQSIVAPVMMCFEDMQYYDHMTFYLLKSIIKNFNYIFMIGCVRDIAIERSQTTNTKVKHEHHIDGITMMERSVEKPYFHSTIITNLQHTNEVDAFETLLKSIFGIHEFRMLNQPAIKEDKPQMLLIGRNKDQPDLKLIVLEQNTNKIFQDHMLFSINKWELIRQKFSLYMFQFLNLKTQGHPLVLIHLMINIISMGLLEVNKSSGIATVTPELRKIVEHEEMLTLQAPICSVQVNGPIIDRLNCLESLIMKVASVIGDIFDLQTLNKINPFKDAINYDTLSKILKELDRKDFIDIMEITENNIYYRFATLNTREVIYQRMTYGQRRELHRNVAEAIHTLPQLPDQDEKKEQLKLEFHWTQTGTKNDNRKTDILQRTNDTNHDISIVDQDPFSQKAKRSMIVKQIQQIMTKNNNNPLAEIRVGILDKKSNSNYTWVDRFCIVNSKHFMYYYNREQYTTHRDQYLGIISLKNIYLIQPYPEDIAGTDKKVFHFQASSWLKKKKEMGKREFFFAASSDAEVEVWTIFLEFSKAKAIYDDFVENFGRIQFPLGSSLTQYDPDISLQVDAILNRSHKIKRSSIRYHIPAQFSKGRESSASKFLAKIQRQGSQGVPEEQREQLSIVQLRDVKLLKDRTRELFYKCFLVFFAQVCEMSLQRNEKAYRTFGQTPKFFIKNQYLFHMDQENLQLIIKKEKQGMGSIQEQDEESRQVTAVSEHDKSSQQFVGIYDYDLRGMSGLRQRKPNELLKNVLQIIPEEQNHALEDHSIIRGRMVSNVKMQDSNHMTEHHQPIIDQSMSDILSYSQFLNDIHES